MSDAPQTVLTVDDERSLTELYAAWLSDAYEVRQANSAADALRTVASGLDPDVVLLDRQMPQMTGDDVLTELRAEGVDCPVVMVTAVDPGFDIVSMPFDDYLVKPVTNEEVQRTVAASLTRETYDEQVRRYFTLARKKAVLETSSAVTDVRSNPTSQELRRELEHVSHTADRTRDELLRRGRPLECN
ncbi:response regulator with chey-like receiver, aaa-type ATPase, and DNA-binding domains [Halogeometricum borinquense DSM 11551]|uniref:response regulator with CheY-like receiver, AAA-type ATPase, and DNA-binding domains n=2 Tax=Halogeometricum borinquense TaxID=60847 RepID=E4NT21_HALBP|nr:response regulator [Halogeometricum borinquense]ADQ67014.1 response regulator with CheY-like receiver, AAA-type ATPase, and DNA-binding domains [Halogeometricum borinquense DSM 11551]ELY29805.1 response regulator with chey-like receiver, aaa-type ATPase, and DNA-binding domains [Halogeometricum borinquense DSM 11551]RYJ14005.1 response regulator [Halogeometricum borinquense]